MTQMRTQFYLAFLSVVTFTAILYIFSDKKLYGQQSGLEEIKESRHEKLKSDNHDESNNIQNISIISQVSNIFKNLNSNDIGQMYVNDIHFFREWAIQKERQFVKVEMDGYQFPDGNRDLNELLMEKGGEPLRSAIFTTWRSGSTFLGEALNANPATYYHYELLLHFDIIQVRDGEIAEKAVKTLRSLMNCSYDDLGSFIEYGKTHHWLYSHNTRLWKYCQKIPKVCHSKQFLSRMCKLFPFQAMKTVRMRLKLAQTFLEDDKLNFRVILLIRDPRGTLQSRQHRTWCPGHPDCDDPERLCKDLEDDYHTAEKFRKIFPTKFLVMRYEDISLNPEKSLKKIYTFLHLQFHPRVQKFLETHTTRNSSGVSSTFRDSKTAPFHWKDDFAKKFTFVEYIQNKCSHAMKLWGYKPADNSSLLADLEPVLPPPWPEMKP